MIMLSESTRRWCSDREHPLITYNPLLNRTYCRCGHRQEPGQQPMDWDAKHEIFHACSLGDSCRCYGKAR